MRRHPRLEEYEKRVTVAQWLGGDKPSAEDREAVESFKDFTLPSSKTHPNTYAWLSLARKFNPEIIAKWKTKEKKERNVFALLVMGGSRFIC